MIGDSNYDLGHLLTTSGGGIAQLRSAGRTGSKARGMSGSSFGTLERYAIDILSHELGHQYGGNHCFNEIRTNCVNRRDIAAVEPGAGTTIMSYAGLCSTDNVQPDADAYFHGFTLNEMIAHINGLDAVPPAWTGNVIPTASAGPDGAVPANTPYLLTGAATDANGDLLTYTWEQIDTCNGAALEAPDQIDGPLIRSFPPTTDNQRSSRTSCCWPRANRTRTSCAPARPVGPSRYPTRAPRSTCS